MRDGLQGKEPQYKTDLDFVLTLWSGMPNGLHTRLKRFGVPDSSLYKGRVLPLFSDNKSAVANDSCMSLKLFV